MWPARRVGDQLQLSTHRLPLGVLRQLPQPGWQVLACLRHAQVLPRPGLHGRELLDGDVPLELRPKEAAASEHPHKLRVWQRVEAPCQHKRGSAWMATDGQAWTATDGQVDEEGCA